MRAVNNHAIAERANHPLFVTTTTIRLIYEVTNPLLQQKCIKMHAWSHILYIDAPANSTVNSWPGSFNLTTITRDIIIIHAEHVLPPSRKSMVLCFSISCLTNYR